MDANDEKQPVQEVPSGVHTETDTDRTPFVGAMIAVAMFFGFQGLILGAFQTPVIGADTPILEPLRFAGITQGVYAVPTLLLFINRKCPKMAKGFAIMTGAVFVGGVIALAIF
ncbi:MAG: hypothetical protein ACJA2W_002583 [Planctomycetota bacterium]|jgi:hypothetical protein